MKLPPIVESAKTRPLSFAPHTGVYIYYDEIANGEKKIYPIEKLSDEQLLELAIKRQLTNVPTTTSKLSKEPNTYTNEQLAEEIRAQTKFGKQMFDADINYLKYYLSQFPPEAFEKTN